MLQGYNVLLVSAMLATSAHAQTIAIIDYLRTADVRERQLPGGGISRINVPDPTAVTTTTRALETAGRIGELAHELEHNEALRSDLKLYDFGVAVLSETQGQVEGMRWPLLIAPEQIDFVADHLCDDGVWQRFCPLLVPAKAPPEHRARMAAALVECIANADFNKAKTLFSTLFRLDRCSPETSADLRSLVEKVPGRFDALWGRVTQVIPAADESRGPESQPLEFKLGSAERAIRMMAAQALFATTLDLPSDVTWVEGLQGDAKTCALAGMTQAIFESRPFTRSPLREADAVVQQQYFTILAQAAGKQELQGLWQCCLSMYINGATRDPAFTPLVRAEAATAIATIHASFPETADKAAPYLQMAAELRQQP